MPRPVRTPHPPDPDAEEAPGREFGTVTDAVVEQVDSANRRARGTVARRVVVRQSRFTGADLGEAILTDVVFVDCRLDLAGLRHATLERVQFRDCRMTECDFSGAQLTDVVFERCELREATFSNVAVDRVLFRGCDLLGARGVDSLRGACMALDDVLANAPTLAAALRIEIVD